MVNFLKNRFTYDHDFATVLLAYLNRYPNPYASHVALCDTLERSLQPNGQLLVTRLIAKTGRLPKFITYLVGEVNRLWIVEKVQIDPNGFMQTYTRNLDHTRVLVIEELTTYRANASGATDVKLSVRVTCGFNRFGIRERLEKWTLSTMTANLKRSRDGLVFVMDQVKARRKLLATA